LVKVFNGHFLRIPDVLRGLQIEEINENMISIVKKVLEELKKFGLIEHEKYKYLTSKPTN